MISETPIEALGHSWGDWTITEPTVTENGNRIRTCSVCSKEESITIYYSYQIGDVGPAGGKIFYIDETNKFDWNYLECNTDPVGIGTYIFGFYRPNGTNNEVVGTDTAIGTGEANTKALVEKMGDTAYTNYTGKETTDSYAAKVAYDYEKNGYDDWFLPSKDELSEIYKNKAVVGLRNRYFLSSSEFSERLVWGHDFSNGDQDNDYGRDGTIYYICPIRAF